MATSMSSLVKIRAERDQMSAIERRIADFILENAHLLRDYSSQQLANSLGISQSSVVKFSQKLGFKGYPDLKVSVSEAVARENGNGESRAIAAVAQRSAGGVGRGPVAQQDARRGGNAPHQYAGEDRGDRARDRCGEQGFRHRSRRGWRAGARVRDETRAAGNSRDLSHRSGVDELGAGRSQAKGDVLVLFSEHGRQPALGQIERQFHERRRQGCFSDAAQRESAARARGHVVARLRARRPGAHPAAAVSGRSATPARPGVRHAVRGGRNRLDI